MAAPDGFSLSKCVRCFWIIFVLFCRTSCTDRTLKLTHVIFRHGNRSPIEAYPSDPYQENSWPQGFGQLTQEGMRQHYELGQWFRKRYILDNKLLNTSYKRDEIHVRSTAYDRTLMSAESNLAGLYPPDGGQVWNKQLSWQPIPVFTKPKTDDALLGIDHVDCPRWKELREDLERMHKDYINKNKEFLYSVAKLAGYNLKNLTYHNLTRIADSMFFEMADDKTLPKWATTDLVKRFQTIRNFTYRAENMLPYEYFKLCTGVLYNEIINHLRGVIAGTEKGKMFMYSGHDDNVFWTLRVLNIFNGLVPPPASCVLIELYQEEDKSYTVDVLLRNNSQLEPFKLQMPGTSGQCTLDHFYKITKDLLLTDVTSVCKAHNGHGSLLPKTWNAGFLPFSASRRAIEWFLFLFMLLIIVLFVCARKWGKLLRNLDSIFKLRAFPLSSSTPDV